MDLDDDAPDTRALQSDDALPPSDWTGIGHASTMGALIEAHKGDLAKYLRRRAPRQDFGDVMQESIGRFAAKSSHALALIEKPGAYLVRIGRNVLADRARSDDAKMQSQHHSFDDGEIAGPDPHAALEAREALRRVEGAIKKLKPQTGSI
jgi:DNA-directed RNA polymerase specialized sigma24 family protein